MHAGVAAGQQFQELDSLLGDEKWRVKAVTLMKLVASCPPLSLTPNTIKDLKGLHKSDGVVDAGTVKKRLMINRDVGLAELDKDIKFTAVNNGEAPLWAPHSPGIHLS